MTAAGRPDQIHLVSLRKLQFSLVSSSAAAKAVFTLSEDSLALTCNSDAARSYRVLQTVTVSIRIEETTGFRRKLCLRIATPEEIEELGRLMPRRQTLLMPSEKRREAL